MSDTQKLLAACVEYRAQLDKLERENAALKAQVQQLRSALASSCNDDHGMCPLAGEYRNDNDRLQAERDALMHQCAELRAELITALTR